MDDIFIGIEEYLRTMPTVSVFTTIVCCDEFSAYIEGTLIYLEDNNFIVECVSSLN